METFMSLLLF